jgi:Asp-tRNA(Asn)/Glu-tRNA(Gln) amidotransferase B subunit
MEDIGDVGALLEPWVIEALKEPVLSAMIDRIILDHPAKARECRKGDRKLLGFFLGHVLAKTKGRVDQQLALDLIQKKMGYLV